jgi:hypothetical protein
MNLLYEAGVGRYGVFDCLLQRGAYRTHGDSALID